MGSGWAALQKASMRSLKRATLFLALLSLLLLLFISTTTLECDHREHRTGGALRVGDQGTRHVERNQVISDVVLEFARAQTRQLPLHSSCSQAYSNMTYPASMLAIGSLNLSTLATSNGQYLLTQAVNSLPAAGWMVSSLVTPLHRASDPTITAILRQLKNRGVELVSLATAHMYSGGDEGMKRTTHYLEAAGIYWVGLTFKENNVITLRGVRVGFLAFCAVYGECMESNYMPFAPIKYNSKVAAGAVSTLKSRGAEVIVVLVQWGRGESYYPDETSLTTARHLASLGVTLVVGYHPLLQQHHAYFEETLVIFSAGNFFGPSSLPQLCWQQTERGQMQYSTSGHCSSVPPSLRSSLLYSEQHTTFYHIHLSSSSPVVADYVSVPLKESSGFKLPMTNSTQWTRVCGRHDGYCLTCRTI